MVIPMKSLGWERLLLLEAHRLVNKAPQYLLVANHTTEDSNNQEPPPWLVVHHLERVISTTIALLTLVLVLCIWLTQLGHAAPKGKRTSSVASASDAASAAPQGKRSNWSSSVGVASDHDARVDFSFNARSLFRFVRKLVDKFKATRNESIDVR